MSAMRKMAAYLGLVDGEDDLEFDEPKASAESTRRIAATPAVTAAVTAVAAPAAAPTVALDRIVTLHPRTYNEARQVGEIFRESVPVIMNLTEMDDADAKRLVDFAAGLVFGLHGSIERVTAKVFLLSPANVSVSVETKHAAAEASFFNQS